MVSCLMGDSTALASAIVRCCLRLFLFFGHCFSSLACHSKMPVYLLVNKAGIALRD